MGMADLDTGGLVELGFEYALPPQRGIGKPSYTDLMICTRASAVAVEAKFLEPPGRPRGFLGVALR